MSFSARSFALLTALALSPLAACGDPSSDGDNNTGGGGTAGPGSVSSGPGPASSSTGGDVSTGSGISSSTGGDVTTTSSTGGDVSTSSSAGGGGAGTTSSTTSATTGQGGAGPATTSSGSTTPGGGCAVANIFCSDFEGGSLPSELQFFPEYLRNNASNFVTLDNTGHSGTRSIKVSGTDFSQMLGIPVPSKFWGRVYLKSDTDIQQGHNTYVAATTSDGDPNNGEHIRIGEHQCQLELNRKSDDKELLSNGGMYQCSGGIKLVANKWYCLEFYYDGPGSEVRVFVDGNEVEALHATGWGPYDYKMFKLGFEKYHGGAKTMWYDDLALGDQRIYCE